MATGAMLIAACSAMPGPSTVLFVWRDAGESLALLPVMASLQRTVPCMAVITGYGTAPASLVDKPGVTTLAALGIETTSALPDRDATLPEGSLLSLLAAVRPVVVVAGLVSAIQLQLAMLSQRAATVPPHAVIGYSDGFARWDSQGWAARALRSASIQSLWVVAEPQARAARVAFPRVNITTMGSPALSSWEDAIEAYGAAALAELRRATFAIAPATPLALYFGGYGATYLQAVQVFADAVARLQAASALCVGFSAHPGFENHTEPEQAIFARAGARVRIVSGVPSALLAGMANLTVSQGSTTGVQSLYVGTAAAFAIGSADLAPANIACDAGLIPWARDAPAEERIYSAMRADGFRANASALRDLGVPPNATKRMGDRIRAWISGAAA